MLTLLAAVLFQIAIYQWQKKHYRSFLIVSLAGLWLLPIFIAITFGNRIFMATWTAYLLMNLDIMRKCRRKPISPSTPRYVYKFYHLLFQATLASGIGGYILFLANTFVFMSTRVFEYSLIVIFYAVYFGVLSRDMIDLVSDLMATSLGVPQFPLIVMRCINS